MTMFRLDHDWDEHLKMVGWECPGHFLDSYSAQTDLQRLGSGTSRATIGPPAAVVGVGLDLAARPSEAQPPAAGKPI